MNVIPGFALLLGCVSLGLANTCTVDGHTLICLGIPSTFSPGFVSMVIFLKGVGEINSTVLHSDNLVNVTRLTINSADITGIASGAFASFQNLQNLTLNQNALAQIDPSWLGKPTVLKDLSLVENSIEVLDESMLSGLTSLTKVNLSNNMIRTIDPRSFSSQANLIELDLSGNRMTQVTPQVFRSLESTRIRLDGNPWDCSCGVEGFVDFLKDLRSRSLLEKEMEVTCKTPASLLGVPVWNVSVCVTTPPSQPPLETETTVHPKPTNKPPSQPPLETETTVHPKPTNKPIRISILIGVIVVLCVLLCVVCFMAVLYRRNRESKTVMPRPLREEREKSEEDSGARHLQSSDHPEKRDFIETIDRDLEMAGKSAITGVRAKSANAVLFTSPFCVAVKDQTKIEGSSEDTKNTAEENQKLQKETQDVGSQPGNANHTNKETEKNEKHAGAGGHQNADENTTCVSVNTKTAPYLSIGTDQYKANPDLSEGQCPNSSSQRSQMGKVLGRISTWPPTSVSWQARCSTKREERPGIFMCMPNVLLETKPTPLEFNNVAEKCKGEMEVVLSKTEQLFGINALESGNKIGILGDTPKETRIPDLLAASPTQDPVQLQMRELLTESRHSQSCLVTSETVCQESFTATEVACSKPNDETTKFRSHHMITTYSPFSEAQTQCYTDLSQDEELNHNPEITAAVGQFTVCKGHTELKNENCNQVELSQSQEPKPEGSSQITERSMSQNTTKTSKKTELGKDQKRAQTREGHSSRRQRGTGSKAPSGGASPSDESLLGSNEDIDLLHEVIQNHGRWTRERWKQMHGNKQRHMQQGQGH